MLLHPTPYSHRKSARDALYGSRKLETCSSVSFPAEDTQSGQYRSDVESIIKVSRSTGSGRRTSCPSIDMSLASWSSLRMSMKERGELGSSIEVLCAGFVVIKL